MTAGDSFAEAISITDYSATPYTLQSAVTTDGGPGYSPIYWSWVPQRTGWYRLDILNTLVTDGEVAAEWTRRFDLYDNDHDLMDVDTSSSDKVVRVQQGVRVFIRVSRTTPPSSAALMYALRIGEAAVPGAWITPPAVKTKNWRVPDDTTAYLYQKLVKRGFYGTYSVQQALGGQPPGSDEGAFSCCWRWARRGAYGFRQWWSPNGAPGMDETTPWSGQPGVCVVHQDNPESAAPENDMNVAWTIESGSEGFYPDVRAYAWAMAYVALNPRTAQWTYGESMPELPPHQEFEWEQPDVGYDTQAIAVTAEIKLVREAGPTAPSKVHAQSGLGGSSWGLHADGWAGSASGGAESLGGWNDYVDGATYPINVADYPAGTDEGFALYVIPTAMLSDNLPPGVSAGPDTSVSVATERGAEYWISFRVGRYRLTPEPQIPDLEPAFGPALQGTGVLLGVTTRFTTP